jgi:DNA-directed RNA polymerase subunit beta'
MRNNEMVLDNKGLTSLLEGVAKQHPNSYTKVLERLKDLGDHFAYREGMSFSMKDFIGLDTPELDDLKPGQALTPQQKEAIRARLKKAVPPTSALALLAESGAKGSWDKIQDLLYSPIGFTDVGGGEVVPRVIRRGFSKGLDWQDYWAASKGARHGLFASSVEVRDPGYFSKQLMRSTMGMTVIPGDSKEYEGLAYPVSHRTVLNRYLAEDIKIGNKVLAEAGDPVTPEMVNAAKKAGINTLMVRSPLTSMAEQGLYARDFGRLPGEQIPTTGTDVGVISGHTLTEPAVQLALKSRHGAGTVDRKGLEGLYAIWPLLNGMAPPGHRAALSPFSGTITGMERTKAGNFVLTLDNGETITTPPADKLWVSKGDKIKRGQQLQEGYADPKEVLEMRGLRDLQMYLVDELEKNYGNIAPDRRYLETVVSGLTRYGVVEDPGERDDLMPGDIVNSNTLMRYNKGLKAMQKPVVFKPMFVGMDMALPTVESDWSVKMLGRDMIRQIEEAAALGLTSSTQNPKPVMPYIYGLDFGRRLSRSGEY